MKQRWAILALAFAPLLAAAEDGIRFDAVITANGQPLARQSAWAAFGQPVVIEVPGKVRIVATAGTPDGDRSDVQARMYAFSDGAWVLDDAMRMPARITRTPSFERTMDDGVHRVVLMPRAAPRPGTTGG